MIQHNGGQGKMTVKEIFALDGQEVTNKQLGKIVSSKHFEEIRKNVDKSYDIVIDHKGRLALITVKSVSYTHLTLPTIGG